MKDVKILDCTLRDGGYINNWQFGFIDIVKILKCLDLAGVEFIEAGFFSDMPTEAGQSLYTSFDELNNYIPENFNTEKLCAMIALGSFSIDKVPDSDRSIVKNLRLIFKKQQQDEALEYSKRLIDKGYNVFIHPTFLSNYDYTEIYSIVKKIHKLNPFCMSIVDSIGAFQNKQLLQIFDIINDNLNPDIYLCFHSHNSLDLSFVLVKSLIENSNNRKLIIDSTICGLGRGAGNLKTEAILNYLNKEFNAKYSLDYLFEVIDNQIRPILNKILNKNTSQYFIAALNNCHTEYARFLFESGYKNSQIDFFLKKIPKEYASIFDKKLIKDIIQNTSF